MLITGFERGERHVHKKTGKYEVFHDWPERVLLALLIGAYPPLARHMARSHLKTRFLWAKE